MNTKPNQADARSNNVLRIDDITVLGEELSEEQLQLISGSQRAEGSSYTEWVGGRTDKDRDF